MRHLAALLLFAVSACAGDETPYALQRALNEDYSSATPEAAPQAPRDTLYLHGSLNVRRAPSQQASLVRTAPRGEKVLLGPKDPDGWAPLYDGTSNQPSGYLYRASRDVRASAPRDEAAAPRARHFSGGSSRARSAADRGYYTGPRGGCYTYSSSGRKRYVDRSYCH